MLNHKSILTGATILLSFQLLAGNAPSPGENAGAAKWVAVLQSDASRKEKADACRELARVGGKEAIAPLAALLGNPELSHMARYGLETIPDPAVDRAFRDALGRLEGDPLVGVIGSIGVRRDAKAVPALTTLLGNRNVTVADAAARALGQIGGAAAAKALCVALPLASTDRQAAICEGLFRCAEGLQRAGKSQDSTGIYDLLCGVSTLPQVRAGGFRGAVLTRGQAALPLLREGLLANDPAFFGAALRVAQELPNPAVSTVLTQSLASGNVDRQVQIVQALAKRKDVSALPTLVDLARSGVLATRLAAIRAFPEIGDTSVASALEQLLTDPEKTVAKEARESLAALPGKVVDDRVAALLRQSDPRLREIGIDLALRRRMTAVLPDLMQLASDSDAGVRAAAIRSLGQLGGQREMAGLIELLLRAGTAGDLEVIEEGLGAFGARTPDQNGVASKLGSAMASATPGQKCVLVRLLGAAATPAAFTMVRRAVDDPDSEVHAAAIRIIANWGKPEAATELLALARNSPTATDKLLCLRSYIGLASHPELPADQRLAMCREASPLVENPNERKLLLAALGGIDSPDAANLIKPSLAQEGLREEAATALVNVAEKLLQAKEAAKTAPGLIEPLELVAKSSTNKDLAARAKKLLDQAKSL